MMALLSLLSTFKLAELMIRMFLIACANYQGLPEYLLQGCEE
jgi:hypothetical protein